MLIGIIMYAVFGVLTVFFAYMSMPKYSFLQYEEVKLPEVKDIADAVANSGSHDREIRNSAVAYYEALRVLISRNAAVHIRYEKLRKSGICWVLSIGYIFFSCYSMSPISNKTPVMFSYIAGVLVTIVVLVFIHKSSMRTTTIALAKATPYPAPESSIEVWEAFLSKEYSRVSFELEENITGMTAEIDHSICFIGLAIFILVCVAIPL